MTPARQGARVFSHRAAMMNADAKSGVGAFGDTGLTICVMATPADHGARVAQSAGEFVSGPERSERSPGRCSPVATVLLMRNHHLRSSWGICTGFALMLGLSLAFDIEPGIARDIERELVYGLTVLALLVLVRSMIVRRRLNSLDQQLEASGLDADPELTQEVSGTN